MTRRENRCHALALLLIGIAAADVRARSWDLAVAIGREVEFYSQNGSQTGQSQIKAAGDLKAIAYDDVTRTLYLSDVSGNASIFSYDLTQKNITTKPLLSKRAHSQVISLAFDTTTRSLFWVDGQNETIMRMQVSEDGGPTEPTLLHDLKHQLPRGLALDVCNRHVYWVNSNSTNPSVERSNLDGSERRIVINETKMYEPVAVAIDHFAGKLYWIDDEEGIHFRVERSNLDGSEREPVLERRSQEPMYLAVDRAALYWSDRVFRAVWTMQKSAITPREAAAGSGGSLFNKFFETTRDSYPAGIVTRDNVGRIDCAAIARMQKRTKFPSAETVAAVAASAPILENYNNLTTSTEESDAVTERATTYCLNKGRMDNRDGVCQCEPGFSGERCETALCHNYCLRGSCKIDRKGQPSCECPTTYTGDRCEKDACEGYCLHGGECSLDDVGRPACKCKHSQGTRCERLEDIAAMCAALCANGLRNPSDLDANPCRCAETNRTAERMVTASEGAEYGTVLPIFSGVIGVLVILIIVLSYYVNKLRRRPRIKKRFVVSKGGVTPLTSRPQIPDNQCEITIENCCNMNICETPCFEPKLRTPVPRSNSTKKEEKNSLLDNMEGNSC